MISTLIRHSDLSSRQSSHSCLSRLLRLCLLRLLRDVCRELRAKFIGDKCIDAWVLFVIFVTGFSSQSFPPAFVFCIRVACEKERQLVFLAFVSEFLFFSLFFFCKGRRRRRRRRSRRRRRRRNKTNKRVVLGLRFGEGGWLGRIGVHLLRLCIFRLSIVSVLL